MEENALRQLSDEALMERFQQGGGASCFGELVRRHRARVFRCCVAFLQNRANAEDVTHDTFVRAFEHAAGFHGGSFSAWISTIARHLCVNFLKAKANLTERLPDADNDPGPGFEQQPEELGFLRADEVRRALGALPDHQRVVLKLIHMNGYSYEEAARLTGFSAKQVKSYAQNGARMFRRHWETLQEK